MKAKKLLSMLLALCLLLTLLPAAVSAAEVASGSCGENVSWSLSDDGTLTISGEGDMDDFYWDRRPGWYDFQESIACVVIKEGVTYIGEEAFKEYDNLTSVTIPASVSNIASDALVGCNSLTGIWVDPGNANYSSDASGVLFNKNKTELVVFPGGASGNYTIPNGVTDIGDYAFYRCSGLTDVTIPDGVITIGDYAFCRNEFTNVTVPSSVTHIGECAFQFTDLNYIICLGDFPIGNAAFTALDITVYYPAGNDTWEANLSLNYGGRITYVAMYEILEGANSTVSCGQTLTVRTNATSSRLISVSVEDMELPEQFYTTSESDTVVTISADLFVGAPEEPITLKLEYADGETITTFSVKHDIAPASCTLPISCKVCGATGDTALGHSFTNYVPNNDATCTKDGTKTAKCDRCDATDTVADVGDTKGHDYAAANCTAPKTCKVCGTTDGVAMGHSFTNYVSNNDATCTEDGTKTAKCDRCDVTDTVADTGSAKDHDFTAAICTAPKTCKVCGTTDGAALGHSFTNYVSNNDATCTRDGTKTAKCDRCDATDTVADIDSAKGHDYAAATCAAPKTCKACGETEGVTIAHADANADNKCDMCGAVLKKEEPTDPAPTDPVPTDPAPTNPAPTDPEPTDPEVTEPKPTEPKPTLPEAEGPQTGDAMDFQIWIALLMLSATGIVLCLILLKRKRKVTR